MTNFKLFVFSGAIVFLLYHHCFAENNRWIATFDCRKASNYAEHEICKDRSLGSLDLVLSAVYDEVNIQNIEVSNEIRKRQILWLKKRNKCKDNDCIREHYINRLEDLVQWLKEPSGSQLCLDAIEDSNIALSKDINGDGIDEIWIGKCPTYKSCKVSFFINIDNCYREQISVYARGISYVSRENLINGHRIMSSESWQGNFNCTESLYIFNKHHFVYAGKRDCSDFTIPGDPKE